MICSITIAVKGRARVFACPEPVVEYVLNNPVRPGLVERWCDYRVSRLSVLGLADAGGGQAPALQRKFRAPDMRRTSV